MAKSSEFDNNANEYRVVTKEEFARRLNIVVKKKMVLDEATKEKRFDLSPSD